MKEQGAFIQNRPIKMTFCNYSGNQNDSYSI